MLLQDCFVPHSLSGALLSLGFNDPCLGYRDDKKELRIGNAPYVQSALQEGIVAPLYQQVIHWFMVTHRIWINPTTVYPYNDERRLKGFSYYIAIWDENQHIIRDLQPYNDEQWEKNWPTYQEAVNKAIREAIKIVEYRKT